MLGAVILQIILISLNAIFASAEIAVISTNATKLEKMAEEGSKKAKRLLSLTENASKFLSTIQVAITLAGLLGSAYAADNFAEPLVEWLIGLGITVSANVLENICVLAITVVLSYFSIVFGELVPKRIAMKNAEKIALALSGTLYYVSKFFAPFVWLLTKSTNGILRLFRINPNEQDSAVTEEELRMMLDDGSERGTIDKEENEMIQNIFNFDDICVSEVCTHRRDVEFLYAEDTMEDWKAVIAKTRHGRYPICGENTDDIIGILNIKSFFKNEDLDVKTAIKTAETPIFVPESMKADTLFAQMKKTKSYYAIVVDEYGGTTGVITVHDLLELLVGDLDDKDKARVKDIEKIADKKWRIQGSTPIFEVEKELELELDEEEYDTFGGYIFGLLGAVPDDGSVFDIETDDILIHVERVEDHRIERTTVTKKEKIIEIEE